MGKTTITMQLAAALSRRHRVLVVDVDPEQSTVWWAENVEQHRPFDFAGSQHPSVLSHLADDYDFLPVDIPGSLKGTCTLEVVVDASDFVIVPFRPEPLAVEPTMRTIQWFIEPRGIQFAELLNRIDARIRGQLDTWKNSLTSLSEFRASMHVCVSTKRSRARTPQGPEIRQFRAPEVRDSRSLEDRRTSSSAPPAASNRGEASWRA